MKLPDHIKDDLRNLSNNGVILYYYGIKRELGLFWFLKTSTYAYAIFKELKKIKIERNIDKRKYR